jgi:hypothetical protein
MSKHTHIPKDHNAHLFSVALLFIVFFRSWFVALRNSQTKCAESRVCDTITVMGDITFALLSGWGLMFGIIFFMWFVEVVVVGIILTPLKPKKARMDASGVSDLNPLNMLTNKEHRKELMRVSLGMRVIVSWMSDARLSIAIVLAIVASAAFSFVIMTIIGWHADDLKLAGVKRNTLYQRGIVAVYIFQLFAMIAFLVYQLWIGSSVKTFSGCHV